jgi:poly-beta-1,6-N-acetyl-D-glucosamine synthase
VLEILYWICAACVAYPYVIYPVVLAVLAAIWARPVKRSGAGDALPGISMVISAYNEEAAIGRRLRELIGHIAHEGLDGEIVIVSDGSTDATASVARSFAGGRVPVLVVELAENVGKSCAISIGCRTARNEIVAFGDVRQTWAQDALTRMLENFADPSVGAVSGELFIETDRGVMAGVGLYWRFEKWMRRQEGLIHSTVGVTGAICAARRSLFRPIMQGTVLDDVHWPLEVVMQGSRVVFDGRAKAHDRLPDHVKAEFRRKVRTLAGNFQLCARLPRALLPWCNPIWFTLVSHKLMRLVVPWAWLGAAALAACIGGPLYQTLFLAQMCVTCVGMIGLWRVVAVRSRIASALGSFLFLNTAAGVALWVWLSGKTHRSWTKTAYRPQSTPAQKPMPVPIPAGAISEGAAQWG